MSFSIGNFKDGFKYYTKRETEYPEFVPKHKRWDYKQKFEGLRILVSYEQGFGDTFMYCRYIPFLKKMATPFVEWETEL